MTPRSWERWKDRYERRGYRVLAPAWPGLEGEVEALRADPSPLMKLDFKKVVDHHHRIICGLDRPPIIMGHSIGGAVTQVLLGRGLGVAGIGLATATVKWLRNLPLSTIRATGLSRHRFHYAFANTMSRAESDAVHERYHVPAANRVLFDVALAKMRRKAAPLVDFRRPGRAPLLLAAFGRDHVVSPAASRDTAAKYTSGTVAFTCFPDQPHFPGAPGWEDTADYALMWAEEHTGAGVPVGA